jgi:hypothetical protein
VFRLVKRLLITAGIGAIASKVMQSRSKGSGSVGSAQWPPIKRPGNKPS